jgi:hypothetical protein
VGVGARPGVEGGANCVSLQKNKKTDKQTKRQKNKKIERQKDRKGERQEQISIWQTITAILPTSE